ncbi:MAG: YCF48-related protein, partial [bacterium]
MRKIFLIILGLIIFTKMSYAVNSWTTQYSSGYVYDISFPDSLHGWAVELKKSAPYGKEFNRILFANDGGKTWTVQPTAFTDTSSPTFITSICFANSLKGLAGGWWWTNQTASGYVGTGWALVSTENAFGTYGWTGSDIVSHYQSGGVIDIETAAGKFFWSSGESGLCGISFYVNRRYIGWQCIGPICFVDTSYGWVCCDVQLFKTTKGVDSLHSLLYRFSMNDIDFIDSLHGWAVGNSGKILYTDNGGVDSVWDTLTSGVTNNLTCVKFVDSLNGWAGGDGIILRTRDGGKNWVTEYSGTVSKICALDTIYAWALSVGNILKYNPVIGIEERQLPVVGGQLSVIKNKIYLSLSNDYYPSTLITIYDLTGRLKETVYSGTLTKGN